MKKLYMMVLLLAIVGMQSCTENPEKKLFSKKYIENEMVKVVDWQVKHPRHDKTDWTNGAMYTGIYAAWKTTQNKKIYDDLMKLCNDSVKWGFGERWFHADDITVAQTYLDLYRDEKRPEMIEKAKEVLDYHVLNPYPAKKDYECMLWWWCDALFMAPPALAKIANITGNDEYRQYMDTYYKQCYDLLYNKDEHLFARDIRYLASTNMRESNGKLVFWGRGNGWVIAGLAKIIQELPESYPNRSFYINVYQEMANKLVEIQQPDGLWRTSLLDPGAYAGGEASGSGFMCYALTWGINNGLLDKAKFTPVVKKAWVALNACVNEEGRVGWVQPIGQDPKKNFNKDSWEVYGTGAYLLAGSEIYKMK